MEEVPAAIAILRVFGLFREVLHSHVDVDVLPEGSVGRKTCFGDNFCEILLEFIQDFVSEPPVFTSTLFSISLELEVQYPVFAFFFIC